MGRIASAVFTYRKVYSKIIDSNETQFDNMDTFQRKLMHRLCERYNLEKEVKNMQDDKATMVVRKNEHSLKRYTLAVIKYANDSR